MVVCSGIAYGFIPTYSCAESLSPCKGYDAAPPGQPCCTKASNYGWRYTLFTLGGVTLACFFLRFVVFRFQESPKWLLYKGKDEAAVEAMRNIAKYNNIDTSISLELFEKLENDDRSTGSNQPILGLAKQKRSRRERLQLELERFKILFSSAVMVRLTILVWIIYAADYWSFTIAGQSITQ